MFSWPALESAVSSLSLPGKARTEFWMHPQPLPSQVLDGPWSTILRGLSSPKSFLQRCFLISTAFLCCTEVLLSLKAAPSEISHGMHQEAPPQQTCAEKQFVICMQAFPFSTHSAHRSQVEDPKGEPGFAGGPQSSLPPTRVQCIRGGEAMG